MGFKQVVKFLRGHALWILCACVFVLGTFVLTRFQNFFISPDETANAFFAHAFARTGSFRVFQAMNHLFDGVLHPRSIVTDGGFLLPGAFLGIVFLYGCFTAILGSWSLTFLTPVIVVVAALAWNQILCRWFSPRIAFVSSVLFLFHPAIWYYSARGLMPNVLFVCCVVFSVWFLLRCASLAKEGKKNVSSAISISLAGFFLGLALFVRLSEVYWLVPLFVFLLITEHKSLSLRKGVLFVIGSLIPIALLLFLNFKTYGSPFTFGYSFVSSVKPSVVTAVAQTDSEEKLSWLLPFGFHPRGVFWHTLDYLFLLFWWLTIPALFSVVRLFLPSFIREGSRGGHKQKIYTIVTIIVALWLCIWYGSWQLNDNPDPTQITIANSYVRYWLPIFILSTPLIASSIVWISERVRSKKKAALILFSCILFLVALNIRIVFFHGQDALVRVVSILQQSEQIRDDVYTIVPENGVIITDRSDKIFFPGRHVMVPLRSEQTYTAMQTLKEKFVPVYYYGITLPTHDFDYLNQQLYSSMDLRIKFLKSYGIESLYEIYINDDAEVGRD